MGKQLQDLTFDQWLTHVFDHPVDSTKLEWYWDPDADWWDGPAANTIQFLTQAFENSAGVFQPYSDAQLNQGLWYIVSNACSNHMFALTDSSVPWPARQRCVRSIHNLFEQCFAARCTPDLSHLDEPGASPLNLVCYMWWDIIPLSGKPNNPEHTEIDKEILGVLESTLHLDSIACRESALHGLGHWHLYYPKQVEAIISTFLENQSKLRKELQTYAMNAYGGCVL
ncbi:MAG TPA: hypothetical protein VF918_08510 [Anaerolineales bacterium]